MYNKQSVYLHFTGHGNMWEIFLAHTMKWKTFFGVRFVGTNHKNITVFSGL
jgi:hypothetical protein